MQTSSSSVSIFDPDSPINLHDGWIALWNGFRGTYKFYNPRTDVTQSKFPASEADAPWFSPSGITYIIYDQARKGSVLNILSRIELKRIKEQSQESKHVVAKINRLRHRLESSELGAGVTEGMFTDLVDALESEQMAFRHENNQFIDFFYARLREARAAIEKLSAGNPSDGQAYHGSTGLATSGGAVSIPAMQPNISSLSLLPVVEESVHSQPHHQEYSAPNLVPTPDTLTRAEPVHTQVHEPQGKTSNHLQGNLVSIGEASSDRKRKRPTPKDPAKFKHKCDTCGERFTRSTTLREHARTHTDERPFPCSRCSKSFARKKDRNRHEELHAGEKKYKCDLSERGIEGQCGREFAREDGLVAHLRTERGWKCLQAVLNSGFLDLNAAERSGRDRSGYICNLTRLACHAKFNCWVYFKDHLKDFANSDCTTEWLVAEFLGRFRLERAAHRGTTRSGREEHIPPNSRQGSSPPQQGTEAPPPENSLSAKSTLPEPLLDITERADIVSPATRFPGNDSAESERATTESISLEELNPPEQQDCDFDPFASWVLDAVECDPGYLPSRRHVSIHIKCAKVPTEEKYHIIFGRFPAMLLKTTWWSISPGVHRGRLEWESEPIMFGEPALEGTAVSVMYLSNHSPAKTYPVGILRYDRDPGRWQIELNPSLSLPANSQPVHETVEGEAVADGNSMRPFSGNHHRREQSTAIEEVANVQRGAVDAPISESEGTLDFNHFLGAYRDFRLR